MKGRLNNCFKFFPAFIFLVSLRFTRKMNAGKNHDQIDDLPLRKTGEKLLRKIDELFLQFTTYLETLEKA